MRLLQLLIAALVIVLHDPSRGLAQTAQENAPPEPANAIGERRSLLTDPRFEQGVYLQSPDQQNRSNIGTIYPVSGSGTENPAWTFSQWHGLYPLTMSTPAFPSGGGVEYKNTGKWAVFGPGRRLVIGLNGVDRGQHTSKFVRGEVAPTGITKIKTTAGISQETWIPGGNYIRLSEMENLHLQLNARLLRAEVVSKMSGTAAVAFVGLHIRNIDPSRRELVYFVVPLYDSRERSRRKVRLLDAATGDKFFIYGTGNQEIIGGESFHDRDWVKIDKDILPLVGDAIKQARKNPKFADYSADPRDYTISQVSLRWEMSADMNVEMEFKNFDLVATLKSPYPSLSIAARPAVVPRGTRAEITWKSSRRGDSCVLRQDGEILFTQLGGDQLSRVVDEDSAFELVCTTEAGSTDRRRVVVKASDSACAILARPNTIRLGQTTELVWHSKSDREATITPDVGKVRRAGSVVVKPTGRTNYILTLGDREGRYPTQCNVVVSVLPE